MEGLDKLVDLFVHVLYVHIHTYRFAMHYKRPLVH